MRLNTSGNGRINSVRTGGSSLPAFAKAFANLESHEHLQTGHYEPRLLTLIPVFVAIWLKSTDGPTDLVYPYFRAHPPLEIEKLYSATDFLNLLRTSLEQRKRSAKMNSMQ
jgi:hypothetical protein